jgi:uncharacterized protein
MEVLSSTGKRIDTNLLVITHLSQLMGYLIGFGSLIVPLILWLSSRDKVEGMNEHGKLIVNFQLSLLLYIIISIPAILLLGLGLLMLLGIAAIGFILPIVNAIRAGRGEAPSDFMTIRFIS